MEWKEGKEGSGGRRAEAEGKYKQVRGKEGQAFKLWRTIYDRPTDEKRDRFPGPAWMTMFIHVAFVRVLCKKASLTEARPNAVHSSMTVVYATELTEY
jgi:hypothetical protein